MATINHREAVPLTWIEGWTFRTRGPQLTFRNTGDSGPASELRFDTGGDHIILKRQSEAGTDEKDRPRTTRLHCALDT